MIISCFESAARITQEFSDDFMCNGELYYAQFGIKGHNGIDLIPTGKDRSMYNIYPGKILKIENNISYGWRVLIWNKEIKIIEYHNHMKIIAKDLELGQVINKSTYIGQMGNTGWSKGAHNHLAYRETDERGYVLNLDNGYRGYVNPRKYIEI